MSIADKNYIPNLFYFYKIFFARYDFLYLRHNYNGLSVLPFDGGTYKNAPFEEVSKEIFDKKLAYIENNPIDLTLIVEEKDNTTQKENLACSGGSCEIL